MRYYPAAGAFVDSDGNLYESSDSIHWTLQPPIACPGVQRAGTRTTDRGHMDQAQLTKIADAIDEIAELFTKLGGTFRGAGGSGSGKAVAGKAKGKSASKPAVELDEDTLREALSELSGLKGKEVMLSALEHVGCEKLAEVDEDDYQKLMDKIEELKEADDEPAKGKTKKGKAKPEPLDADEVLAAYKKLAKTDKAAAKKALKAAKLATIDDFDEDDEDVVQALHDAVEAASE